MNPIGIQFNNQKQNLGTTPNKNSGRQLIQGLRELHWHMNADEWQYYIAVRDDYVRQTLAHYIENTGNTDLVFLEMFYIEIWKTKSFCRIIRFHHQGEVRCRKRLGGNIRDVIP